LFYTKVIYDKSGQLNVKSSAINMRS